MMLCQHEEIAVQIAHGYAKATGRPMAVILHDLVGCCTPAWRSTTPISTACRSSSIGAPPDGRGQAPPAYRLDAYRAGAGQRHPRLREMGLQPTSIEGVPESFARAYSIMTTQPQGPVYMCYDAALQEEPLAREVALPPVGAAATPTPMAPDPSAIVAIADKLLAAEHPMLLAEYAGRRAGGFESIVALARPPDRRVDVNNALKLSNKHPLCLSMDKDSLRHTDLVVALDVKDWEKQLTELNSAKRTREQITPPSCDFVEIGFGEINISKWAMDYCRMQPCSIGRWATPPSHPRAHAPVQGAHRRDAKLGRRIAERKVAIGRRHDEVWAKWQEEARKNWDASPITFSRLAMEVWEVIKDEDWVLTPTISSSRCASSGFRPSPNVIRRRARHVHANRHLARVALAHKGKGRVVVDIQPDGDLMFDAGALWVAPNTRIPMLVVMHNNRAYYNDWEHQIAWRGCAHRRGQAHIAWTCSVRSPTSPRWRVHGLLGEGPIDKPQDIRPALLRALAEVKKGRLALVDTITQHR